jgi:hypothetical protein
MSDIIQNVSITKHINPSKQISDEYTLMITYHDVVYITKIKEEDFKSVLFEFDMLENLIYNCNHKQKVGDICCDMTIKESESFGKILDIILLFERDVKPMKKINEKHEFQLQEKKLDYDDKIGLAMTNLRNEINFVEIKPTTEILIFNYNMEYSLTNDNYLIINNNHPEKKTNIKIKLNHTYYNKQFNLDKNSFLQSYQPLQNQTSLYKDKTTIMTLDDKLSEFNKFTNYNTSADVYWELLEYVRKTFFTSSGELIEMKFESALDYYLKNNFVDMIKIKDPNNLILFIDKSKKSNNRKIKFYKNIDEFQKNREQFKTYHILEMKSCGIYNCILIEEIN